MNQQLTGGGSTDTFMFLGSGHNDTVTDFNVSADKLDFENTMTPADFSDVTISAGANGAAVVQFDGNTVQLAGVTPDQLGAGQFVFNQNNPALQVQHPTV
jgi:Ca2+-binding RTX toxin-like protein